MAIVSMKNLLEAGVHFGHQTRRWNPKMKPYIFTERNDIYIIDLQKTLALIESAYAFVRETVANGGSVMFVATKKQAHDAIEQEAVRCEMPYVNCRWLGGMLTNFETIKKRIDHLKELEEMQESGLMEKLPKKEASKLLAKKEKLAKNLTGIRNMNKLPDIMFVIDTKKEQIAVNEARRLEIPIVGVVDTNADPDEVDYIIPANDDAIRAVTLLSKIIADACLEGVSRRVPVEEEQEKLDLVEG
ncbi:30S ribosomal protein S2 [Candidatus Oleimmundimicrobium sp.]|uniref:30S ribosomal protein S2 n=1 Tax=Candidatus Oleimmundimicrobium sp. TaxID=3060597 RepID=UPI002717DB22|nr:30S ribosomal protein S2 [Candidatus Oleimmundimicrobium sp.]MDO8886481.1 30S ribosomal protein S2 [Candidatus Oleimmundimicrobium sp.]